MCGIAGLLYADVEHPVSRQLLDSMGETIAHRGPDASGTFRRPGIGMVHRRLSIVDISGGDQPIANEDGRVTVVFNGEIYNHRSLRRDLQSRGHIFRTHTDTEVLVHLYEEHGEHLVDHLRGMFALAIWDAASKQLLLARDRIGIKPLYVYADGEKLLFGSELKAIVCCPEVRRELDAAALEDYLAYGTIPGSASIFRNVRKLLPGHVLSVRPPRLETTPRRYWQLEFAADHGRSLDEWQEALRWKLHETIQSHLMSDVPVGAFLSGGLDSSVIVSYAAESAAERLKTFSMGFEEDAFNELPYARQVAKRYGTEHVEHVVTPDAARLVDRLSDFYDEPFADSSSIPTYLVSQFAAQHVKVVLSGDGGDEAFAGYPRYAHDLKETWLRGWIPRWLRRSLLAAVARQWPRTDWLPRVLRWKTLLTNLSLDAPSAYANTLTRCCRLPLRRQLMAPELRARLLGHDPTDIVRRHFARSADHGPLAGMISADLATFLPDDYLVKVDRASMAHGLEVRPPLLDHQFLELCAQIPAELQIRRGETKWLLKKTFAERMPTSVVRRKKQGFEIPVDRWLRGPLREQFHAEVLDASSPLAGLIDQDVAKRMFLAHLHRTGRHGSTLWALLALGCWARRYLRTATERQPAEAGSAPSQAIVRCAR